MALTWNGQQSAALDDVAEWLMDPHAEQVYRLFGYAGTGKTTLARHLAMQCRNPMFAAFTGKAALVLREMGCPNATTLHSLLYNVRDRDRDKLISLEREAAALDPGHADYRQLMAEVALERDKVKRPWFYVNEESRLRNADLLVCDEVSMVDARIGKDMESFGKKILVLGDPAQLPPVGGGGYFTNRKPNTLLTEIHRQAADNPILRWATLARRGEVIPFGDEGAAKKFQRAQVSDEWLAKEAGQILVGKNDTRRDLNKRIRKIFGRTSQFPVHKDTLVILMNDHKLGLLNGTIVMNMNEALYEPATDPNVFWTSLVHKPDGGSSTIIRDLKCDARIFLGQDPGSDRSAMQLDFGYALTVHKAQGSQWPTVTIYDDGFGKREPETRRRWLYTAITRAQGSLNILTS